MVVGLVTVGRVAGGSNYRLSLFQNGALYLLIDKIEADLKRMVRLSVLEEVDLMKREGCGGGGVSPLLAFNRS